MSFAPEPAFAHGAAAKTAVVLCNLGTPDEPTPAAVRRYLAEFLERPARGRDPARCSGCRSCTASSCARARRSSARKYATIWTPEGSPLKVWTEKQAHAARRLSRPARPPVAGPPRDALRPAVDRQRARRVKAAGAERVLVLPLYPQYAAATTASVGDAVAAWMRAPPQPARAALRQALPRRSRATSTPWPAGSATTGRPMAGPTGWC